MNAETAIELRQSILWAEFIKEVDLKIDFEMSKLLRCSPEALGMIQSKIECYKSIINLPQDIIDRESQ